MVSKGNVHLEAAHAAYAAALRSLNILQRDRDRKGAPDYEARLNEAYRRVRETRAKWLMLYEHETGAKRAKEDG